MVLLYILLATLCKRERETRNYGIILYQMKYAILSDVHANLDALERVLDDAQRCHADRVICLGDIVGYGPLPKETLHRVRASSALVVAGNHDDAVSGRLDAANFIDLAGDAVARHRDALARDDLAYLKTLPYVAKIEGALLAHGDLTDAKAFNYIDGTEAAEANFAATDAPLVFVGHTHVPCIYLTGQSGRVYALGAEDFVMEDGKRYIVNVGSVGYPRESNGQCLSSYVLYDTDERSVRYRLLPFAVNSVMQRGKNARRAKGLVVGAIGLLALAVAILFVSLRPRPVTTPLVVEAPTLKPIKTWSTNLTGREKKIAADLVLAPKSPEVLLTISCFDAKGQEKTIKQCIVKGQNTVKYKIPENAVRAAITLNPMATNETPVVKRFNPRVVP